MTALASEAYPWSARAATTNLPQTSAMASEISAILTAEILRGEREADSPLRQAPLAQRFNVSRTPIGRR